MNITVVGAGVIGLTCAVELEAAGHDVTVIGERVGDELVSSVAGAIWFPYRAGPPDKVARWAARTRARLEALAGDPATGVAIVTCFEINHDDAPWWLPAAPDAERIETTLPGRPHAWRLRAPRIEPARFLAWLTARLSRPIVRARVTSLDDVDADVVVNATGLGARTLAGDPELTGLAGQVVITAPGEVALDASITDDRVEDAMFYVIPRGDTLVLGGCAVPDEAYVEDAALTDRILADAACLGLHPGPVIAVRTGLRPYRPEVRLERVGRVIHCYGHGGAGFTLGYGCAEDVARLV